MLKQTMFCLSVATFLVACSQDPEPAADAPGESAQSEAMSDPSLAASSEATLEQIAENPEALREAMRDPEQREELIQAMRERREAQRAERMAQGSEVDRTAMREQMRERRAEMMAERGEDGTDPREQMRERMLERSRWWSDETIQSSIGLSEAQSEALTSAQMELEEQRQSYRQALGQNQQDLMNAVREGDRSRIMDLVEQRSTTQGDLQNVDMEWWRLMLDQLSDEQLAILAEENPQVLLRRGGR